MAEKLIDLSHRIVAGMTTYPGLDAPKISAVFDHDGSRTHYSDPTCFHIGRINMVANTGTYIDAPFHRYPDQIDIAGLPLERLALVPARMFVVPEGQRAIGPELFAGVELADMAVLVRTDWSRNWGEETYFHGHPFLNEAAAQHLVAQGVRLVGIDSLNIDGTDDGHRPVHSLLLKHGIPIVEHLTNLDKLPEKGFRFSAVPAPVAGMGSFPVRAFACLGSDLS